ncbi:MAG: hypothetical protein OXI95_12000 [bacterium]|nr:hypothetical protein [bacterium]
MTMIARRRVPGIVTMAAVTVLAWALVCGLEAAADDAALVETPEARTINVAVDDNGVLVRGFAADIDGMPWRLGVVVVCDIATGRLEGHLSFGSFPENRPVQAAVLAPDGALERFGPVVVTEHGALSGFHSPIVEGDDVLRLMTAAFEEGALVSNGWRSVWNRIPEADNARARADILECAG